MRDLYDNAALTYLTGFIAVTFGLLIIGYHNLWVADWRVLITIIGWLALIKGLIFIVLPKLGPAVRLFRLRARRRLTGGKKSAGRKHAPGPRDLVCLEC